LSADVVAVARRLLQERGLATEIVGHTECRAGGNNRVIRLDTDRGPFVAKLYFDDAGDRRDRLQSEYAFLEYATRLGLRSVPSPIACDAAERVAIHAYVPGRTLSADRLTLAHVQQAIGFFRALNAPPRPGAEALPPASDGGFSIAAHVELVDRRLARLREIPAQAEVEVEARAFVGELAKAWETVKIGLGGAMRRLQVAPDLPLSAEERCVSPSDFGFHNALEPAGETIVFVDFEYAGWDDPAKAVADFFCQPLVPVDRRWFREVATGFTAHAPNGDELVRRAAAVFPLFWFKWCLIRLNEFTPVALRRRVFADPGIDVEARKWRQLQSAREALAALPDVEVSIDDGGAAA
jgi:phosphotransferase family enzyme